MPLPKISTPTYELELPSTGESIEYRPFLVREEKLLVLAMESEDTKSITRAIKEVLRSCIKTKGIKVDSLPTFDIEYLFLNIRGKSVGEEVEVTVTCPDDDVTEVDITIPIDEIEVKRSKNHINTIKLDDNLSMKMKYPSLTQFIDTNFDVNTQKTGGQLEQSFSLIGACIDTIYSDEEAWPASESSKKEIGEFLEQLSSSQFADIEQFFETMPKLSHEDHVTNPKTKKKSTVLLEGLASFFG